MSYVRESSKVVSVMLSDTSSDFLRAGWDQEEERIQEQSFAKRWGEMQSCLIQQSSKSLAELAYKVTKDSCHPAWESSWFVAGDVGRGS